MKHLILFAVAAGTILGQASILPQADLKPETVVATIEGKDVTLADVRKMVAVAPPQFLQQLQADPQAALATFFMIRHLAEEGDKLKLAEQSPLKEQLEFARTQAVAGQFVNNERDQFPVSDDDINQFFEKNRANYESAHIRVIQISFKPATTAPKSTSQADIAEALKQQMEANKIKENRTEAEAQALAADVVKQLRGGADFLKLVQQYSDDQTTKISGGDFGTMKRDSSYPEDLKKAVFAMNPGDTSDPVKVSTAFYVIRLEEKTVPPIAEVRPAIVQTIRQQHLAQFLQGLNAHYRPVVKSPEFFTRPAQALGLK